LKTLLGVISLAAPTNKEIIKDSATLTDFLLLQQQQYRSVSDNYLTYYGYETKATPLPGGSDLIIVPKVSAVPPSATESQCIEMTADHVGIAKYETVVDETFQCLALPVQAIAEDSRARCQKRWKKFRGELLLCC
jgi:hypothetical protein